MRTAAIAVFCLATGPTMALSPVHEKACILASAANLPERGPILASRITPMPADLQAPPDAVRVELDISISGVEATYAFVCLAGDRAYATFVGLVR